MSKDEYMEFLSSGTKTGHLATVRKDGRPHVVPIWFVMDGDILIFNTGKNSVKGKNLSRDNNVCISVDNPNPLYDFVQIQGTATISEDPKEMLKWATAIGGRYMGEDQAVAYGKRNSCPGEILVKVKIDKINAYKDVAAW
ncbi:MAG: TIGR03618 family F420-dependent PPOX class oxidoreductase [Candidatus Dadabacteria bacterium]|nr:TIGR03618 family F420-dependent PPOX class oxidoreductase [Candidatus Dadabacteria bacterium]NIQ15221.1 TIGR03618 family F420-dependent PPOX class oxidoreductase [Candidatus Dadabacteria bacterium]